MRNYQERKVLGGLLYLRKYDRMDLLWGLAKDVERDLVYSFVFSIVSMVLILTYAICSAGEEKYYGNI